MPELTEQRLEEYLNDLRALRRKVLKRFKEATQWNLEHPGRQPITDDDVDPDGVLRAFDRQLWQLIGDWEVAKAMGRFHQRLDQVERG